MHYEKIMEYVNWKDELSKEDRLTVAREWIIECFLSQPFLVAIW